MTWIDYSVIFAICILTEKNFEEHEESWAHHRIRIELQKFENLKWNNQFTPSGDFQRNYKTEITSFSPNFFNTSVQAETIKIEMKFFFATDLKSLVRKFWTKFSFSIKQRSFRFQVSFYAIFDEDICIFRVERETCSDYIYDVFVSWEI